MTNEEMVAGLRRQMVVQLRLGYDGHSRRPLTTSRRRMRHRRWRRNYGVYLRHVLFYWN